MKVKLVDSLIWRPFILSWIRPLERRQGRFETFASFYFEPFVLSISVLLLTLCVTILTTNLAACVCLCVRKILPISPLTLLFHLQTSRKFCSHSKIPIRCLWTAFCVPLSFIFYEKRWFIMQIVTLRRSRFAAVWQMDNSRNPFSRRGWMARGQRENVVSHTKRNATITVQTPCREQYFFFIFIVCN